MPNIALDSLDVQFAEGINELIADGLDFDKVAQDTVREVIGDTPFGALLPSLDTPKQAPQSFVRRLEGIFPISVVRTLILMIIRKAMASLASIRRADSYPAIQSLLGSVLVSEPPGAPSSNERLLHDHREQDELDLLVGHKTD